MLLVALAPLGIQPCPSILMASLLDTLTALAPEKQADALDAVRRLEPERAARLSAQITADLLARCVDDGVFWLRFVVTRDEADVESVKPFPRHTPAFCFPPPHQCLGCKIAALWRVLDTTPRLAIPKSRQMMVSWLACAYAVWHARFRDNRAVYWQTQNDDDANKMVALPAPAQGRMEFIERHLPAWMQVVGTKFAQGVIAWPNGSVIEALAGGANKVRSKVASLIIEDEFAHQEEARGVYTAVGPLIQKATKFLAISTPNGTDNVFFELVHGYRVGLTSGI